MAYSGEMMLTHPAKRPLYGAANPFATKPTYRDPDNVLSRSDLPALTLPWFFFGMSMLLLALMEQALLSYIAFGTCAVTSMFFLLLSSGSGWRVLAAFCFVASGAGFGLGWLSRHLFSGVIGTLYDLAILAAWAVMPIFLALLLRRIGMPLTAQEAGPDWRPAIFDLIRPTWWYPHEFKHSTRTLLQQRLLRGDVYWTGEVIQDYLFHVSNSHTFVGVFCCHPAHPYEWWERAILAACIVCLIVFPVSVFCMAFRDLPYRTIIIFVLAFVPREVMKWYFLRMNMENAKKQVDKGMSVDLTKFYWDNEEPEDLDPEIERAVVWEWFTIVFTLLGTTAVVVVSVLYINHHRGNATLYHILISNSDALGFAFILELAIDLLHPMRLQNGNQVTWAIGFFHAWYRERLMIKDQGVKFERENLLRRKLRDLHSQPNAVESMRRLVKGDCA